MWNPKLCPERLLYVLAIALQVDEWNEEWGRDVKEETLLNAWHVHITRGTPSSIKRVLQNLGYAKAVIEEEPSDSESWFQYSVHLNAQITVDKPACGRS